MPTLSVVEAVGSVNTSWSCCKTQILDEGVFYRKYVTSTYTRMKKILEANDDVRDASRYPAKYGIMESHAQ